MTSPAKRAILRAADFLARLRLTLRIWWGGRPHVCPEYALLKAWRIAPRYMRRKR